VYGVGGGMGWAGGIYPYLKSSGVYICPSDPFQATAGNKNISYSYNFIITDVITPAQQSQFTAPANTVALYETTTNQVNAGVFSGTTKDTWSSGGCGGVRTTAGGGNFECDGTCVNSFGDYTGAFVTASQSPTNPCFGWSGQPQPCVNPGRHNGAANWLAADGHVKYLPATKVSCGWDGKNTNGTGNYSAGGLPTACGASKMTGPSGEAYALTFAAI